MIEAINKGVGEATTSIVSSILSNLWGKIHFLYEKYMIPAPDHFLHYTSECYDRFLNVKCLARGQALMPLKRIYVPLTLIHANKKDVQIQVDRYNSILFERSNSILIVDNAGMGKSTLVKKLFIDIIEDGNDIPIFIELRRLSRIHTIIDEIVSQLTYFSDSISLDLLSSLIIEGKFIFILDGYDEIAISDKEVVTADLQQFLAHSRSNRFIMTSRQELALTSFEGFDAYNIEPLSKEEAFVLLQNYDDEGCEVSSLLISQLDSTNDFDEFLGNPLLASMLLTAFSFKNEIPRQKHIFYRTVFDAYFNSHDLTKGGAYQHEKNSGLGMEEFHKLLRFTAIVCLKKGRIEFTKDDLMDTIDQALKLCPEIYCSPNDFFMDLLEVVPLFVQDGIYYRWAHKSLYEYFAAQSIYRDSPKKGKILVELASHERIEKYYNLLDLYYEIDFTTFRQSVIKSFLQQLVTYVERVSDLNDDVIRRRQCTFIRDDYIVVYLPEYNQDSLQKVLSSVLKMESSSPVVMWDTNKTKTLYLFRCYNENRNELMLGLLAGKRHHCVNEGRQCELELLSSSLNPGHLYRITNDKKSPLNNSDVYNVITSMMESFSNIDYYRAKDELRQISEDVNAASIFANELFS